MSGAAMVVVLDRGTDISDLADAENPLVVDMNAAVMAQIVIEPPVALIRTFRMELFEFSASRSFSAVRRLSFPEAHLW